MAGDKAEATRNEMLREKYFDKYLKMSPHLVKLSLTLLRLAING
jgi:hypothetical protein